MNKELKEIKSVYDEQKVEILIESQNKKELKLNDKNLIGFNNENITKVCKDLLEYQGYCISYLSAILHNFNKIYEENKIFKL